MKRIGILMNALLLLFIGGCEAPRLNPFDPKAENALDMVESQIQVQQFLNPQKGIEGVLVIEPNLQLSGVTNAQGQVNWVHPRVDTLRVLLSKKGYFSATYHFPIRANFNQFVGFLNAEPVIRRLKFTTIHNVASQVDYIRLETVVDDPDGEADIQDVVLQLPDSGFSKTLARTDSSFEILFNKTQISPDITAGQLPALNFQMVVFNTNGDSIVKGPLVLRRVITTELTPLLPNPERAESGSILFTWKAVTLDYPFNFRVVLYASTGTISKIGEFYPIPSTATQYELNDPEFLNKMETGTYLWNLEIEDQFGNIAESSVLQFQYFK